MANYLFPRESTSAFGGGAGVAIKVYTDQSCTTLATITNVDGSAVGGSTLTLDGNGYIPAFIGTAKQLWAALASVTNPDRKGASTRLTPVGEAAAGSSEWSGVLMNLASMTLGLTTWTGWDIATGEAESLEIDINVTAISGAGAQVVPSLQRKGVDGIYYTIWTGAAITTVSSNPYTVGVGASTNVGLGEHCRLLLTVTGTTPSVTLTGSVQAVVTE